MRLERLNIGTKETMCYSYMQFSSIEDRREKISVLSPLSEQDSVMYSLEGPKQNSRGRRRQRRQNNNTNYRKQKACVNKTNYRRQKAHVNKTNDRRQKAHVNKTN